MDAILGITTCDRCGRKMEKGQNILIVAEGVVKDSSEKLDFQNNSVLFACHQECWEEEGEKSWKIKKQL